MYDGRAETGAQKGAMMYTPRKVEYVLSSSRGDEEKKWQEGTTNRRLPYKNMPIVFVELPSHAVACISHHRVREHPQEETLDLAQVIDLKSEKCDVVDPVVPCIMAKVCNTTTLLTKLLICLISPCCMRVVCTPPYVAFRTRYSYTSPTTLSTWG